MPFVLRHIHLGQAVAWPLATRMQLVKRSVWRYNLPEPQGRFKEKPHSCALDYVTTHPVIPLIELEGSTT